MSIGNVVDYVIEYNEIHDVDAEAKPKEEKREATQADWDMFFG